jgi:hypothetical protein
LTPVHRLRLARLIVDHGWPPARAAESYDVSWRTAKKWADRYRCEGPAGMVDRSSAPHRQPNRTPAPVVRKIVHLRWKQRLGPVEIGDRLKMPLVIASHGGVLPDGTAVQRTFATVRSVELDVVLVAGAPAPAPDALPTLDAKAGVAGSPVVDPRGLLLVEECFRHAKAIGAWGEGVTTLEAAACTDEAGIIRGEVGTEVLAQVEELMARHRVWERFEPSGVLAV